MKDLLLLLRGRQRTAVLALGVALLMGAALEMIGLAAVPAFISLLIDPAIFLDRVPAVGLAAISDWDRQTVAIVGAACLAFLFMVKNVFLGMLLVAEAAILRRVTASLQVRLFAGYMRSPYTFHLQRNPAESIRNINNATNDAIQYLRNTILGTRELLVILAIIVLLVAVDPVVSSLVFFVLGASVALFHVGTRRTLRSKGDASNVAYAQQLKIVNESLGAIKHTRMQGREGYAIQRFSEVTKDVWRHQFTHNVIAGLPRLVLETVSVFAVLLVAVTFVTLGRQIESILPFLSLLAVAVIRLIPSFNVITTSLGNLQYYRRGLEIVTEDIRVFDEHQENDIRKAEISLSPMSCNIRVEDVAFRYQGAPSDTLSGISLEIAAGEAVGITGQTGAGKSTLVDVILGLLPASSGRVLVDGADIKLNSSAWQKQIGYVPQDIYLTDDSIRRNIAFGVPDELMDEGAIVDSVASAQLTAFIASLPEGMGTLVGDRGVRISGGQRQRIGIARALYHRPRILVLDEATSALDDETEREVIGAIDRLKGTLTLIVVAHRAGILHHCDRVIQIVNGRVVE